jgi:hypothetical protein
VARVAAHDPVALAEIEMYSNLIIAAAATEDEQLPPERIDQIIGVERPRVPPQRLSDDVPSGG